MSIFGGLGTAFESAFTPAGTNAHNQQVEDQRKTADILQRLAMTLGTNPEGLAATMNSDDAMTRQAIMALYNRFASASDPAAQANLAAAGANRAMMASNGRAANAARGAGFDRAFTTAVAAGDPLVAARAEAEARERGRQTAMGNQQGALRALGGLQSLTGNRISLLSALNSGVQNQAPVPVGPSVWDSLSALAGQAAGAARSFR